MNFRTSNFCNFQLSTVTYQFSCDSQDGCRSTSERSITRPISVSTSRAIIRLICKSIARPIRRLIFMTIIKAIIRPVFRQSSCWLEAPRQLLRAFFEYVNRLALHGYYSSIVNGQVPLMDHQLIVPVLSSCVVTWRTLSSVPFRTSMSACTTCSSTISGLERPEGPLERID